VSDPVTGVPEEALPEQPYELERVEGALALLRRRDFRRTFLAITTSELGGAFHYIALMWTALTTGGPLGVIAVRLADSVPALLFGLHGGVAADRWSRKRIMIGADLVRAAVLVPVAAAALAGHLPLWGLVVAAFLLETAASYFEPAYGSLLPSLVDRRNVQAANALVRATADALSIGGWALAAGLLAFVPVSAFFALTAATFLASAALLVGIRPQPGRAAGAPPPRIREGFAALRPLPALAVAVAVIGVGVTITAGSWIAGVPELVRTELGRGAGAFSLVMVGYAVGSVSAGVALARRDVRGKALASLLAWTLYLPAYLLLAFADDLPLAFAGAVFSGLGQSSAVVLAYSAAQRDVPDAALGRVVGLISLVHRGAHATGLVFVSPLFAIVAPGTVFAAAAVVLPLLGLAGAAVAVARTRTAPYGGAQAP